MPETTAGQIVPPYTVQYFSKLGGGDWVQWGKATTRDEAEPMMQMAAKSCESGRARILESKVIVEISA